MVPTGDPLRPADATPAGDGRPSAAEQFAMLDGGPFTTIAIEWDGTVRWASQSLHDLLGLDVSELVGRDVFTLLHPDEAERARSAVQAMTSMHLRARGMVYRLRHASGAYQPCLVAAQPFEVDGHSFVQIAIMSTPMRLAVGEALQSVVRGATLAESLTEIERVVNRTLAGALFGMSFVEPETGRRKVVGSVPTELAGLRPDGSVDDRPELPWATVAAHLETQVFDDPSVWPADIAAVAAAHGQHTLVVTPVPDPASGEPTLIIGWVPIPQVASVLVRGFEDALAPVVELVLDRQHHLRQVRWAAEHDALTQLGNRTQFYDRLAAELHHPGDPVAVLYLDLDGFKAVNDAHGHAVGDCVLQAVARRIIAVLPPEAFVGRLGGDEFAVALPGAGLDEGALVADALLREIAAPIDVAASEPGAPAGTVAVGVSIGIATGDTTAVDDLVAAADAALLEAKQGGKGRWRLGAGEAEGPPRRGDRRAGDRRAGDC